MKLINLLSIIFCLYACISKGISWFTLKEALQFMKSQDNIQYALMMDAKFQSEMAVIWFSVFALLIILWGLSFFRKLSNVKIYIVSFTILGALLMSISDNMETEVYISDIVVGGEMINY